MLGHMPLPYILLAILCLDSVRSVGRFRSGREQGSGTKMSAMTGPSGYTKRLVHGVQLPNEVKFVLKMLIVSDAWR